VSGLARRYLGGRTLWFFGVSASAPMTVLVGGVVTTYAATGVVGVPIAFVGLTVALLVVTVGAVAMARHVGSAAPLFTLPARGLGRPAGMVGAVVALLAYNAVQIALYGLLGASLAAQFGGPWWAGAAVAWVGVGVCGALRVDLSGGLLAILLGTELLVIAVFDIGALTHPTGGMLPAAPLLPSQLAVNGIGGVLALSGAGFLGYESGTAYSEEARTDRSVPWATLGALGFLGPFYALSSYALAAAGGPDGVVAASRADPDLPFTIMAHTLGVYGPVIGALGRLLLITSIFAAMLSFHSTVARYIFGLAREGLLPARLARTGVAGGAGRDAPIGGSLLQSGFAALVVAIFALLHADPITVLFTWLAAGAAVGILALLVLTSAAARRWFARGGGTHEGVWVRSIAPTLGVVVGVVVVAVMLANLDTLLGVPAGSPLRYIIPACLAAAVGAGLGWAAWLRLRRPEVYERIGRGRPHPLVVPDARLNEVRF
jgi:amino acid transporter